MALPHHFFLLSNKFWLLRSLLVNFLVLRNQLDVVHNAIRIFRVDLKRILTLNIKSPQRARKLEFLETPFELVYKFE